MYSPSEEKKKNELMMMNGVGDSSPIEGAHT